MGPRDEGSAISARRAFVVHLAHGGRPGRRRFSGRVEHLASGQSARFSSLEGLLGFFASVLDTPADDRMSLGDSQTNRDGEGTI